MFKRKKPTVKRMLRGTLSLLLALCFIIPTSVFPSRGASFDEGSNFRVGLVYGSNVKKAITVTSTSTYTMGVKGLLDGTRDYFSSICTFPAGTIYVTADGYGISGTASGGYHVQCTTDFSNYAAANTAASAIKTAISSSYTVIPCYIDGKYKVRVGDFASSSAANSALSQIKSKASSYSFAVSSPSDTCMSIFNSSGTLIFEFSAPYYSGLGLKVSSGYMTYNNKTYEGIFAFSRYKSGSYNGVQLVSTLPIERYVMCVIPNEVMTSWSAETLKAFAVTVRSYALSMKNNYESSYHFDITSTSQVYGMASNVDAKTIAAVQDTAGLVIAYNGTVAQAYYSSSVGGVTVGSGDAYVTDLPYLKAVTTPWEKYSSLSSGYHGMWTVEYTGAELLTRLKNYGYSNLTGTSITSLKINSYGENSTYVKSITVTDNKGNTATISKSDTIRIHLGLYSANFVCGIGSVTYTYDTVTTLGTSAKDGAYPAFNLAGFNVITALGNLFGRSSRSTSVQTSSGVISNVPPKANVITGKNTSNGKDVYTVTTTTATAKGASGSFVFAGKGYGHGVGLSQFGIRDLGNLGYGYEEMLDLYFTNVVLVKYTTLK